MPKRKPRRNDSDYLRFRPYQAFTSSPAKSDSGWSKVAWRILLGIGLLAIVIIGIWMAVR